MNKMPTNSKGILDRKTIKKFAISEHQKFMKKISKSSGTFYRPPNATTDETLWQNLFS